MTALTALGTGSGLGAENGAAPTSPSSPAEGARQAPSQPKPAPDPSQAGVAAPAATSPPAAPGNPPTIVEWLNQTVRLRDTVQALDRPSPDGQAAGLIRGGAEVKAVGIIAGKQWVQIELPNQALAYIPAGALELTDNNAASSPGQPPGQGPEPATTPAPGATSPLGVVRGPVTSVPNAASLVVADQRIRLSGIDPGPSTALAPFESWVRAQGALQCEPDAQTGRFHCFTSSGVDVAEAAILNGAGRVGDGATPAYRESETQARTAKRGFWAEP